MKNLKLWLLFICSVNFAFAEDKLQFRQLLTEVPTTSKTFLKESFSEDSLPYWGVILSTTGVLYHYDEEIYAELQKRGRNWGVGNEDNTSSVLTISGHEIVRLPSDTGSFLYFLGDGWMHAGIGAGFVTTGQIAENNYTFNTGIMIWHGMLVSTIFNQVLKRSLGRESPEVSTSKRGSWHLFPGFNDYNSKTASYDAMPSGHIMTATLTFTILSERYPEYNQYIYPIYGVWASALMFQMVNNGVHWASDYPLGIAMGYMIGKKAAQIGTDAKDNLEEKTSWHLLPSANGIIAYRNFL